MDRHEEAREKDPQTYAIIGAAFEVHRQLGAGFLEAVYQEALAIEFTERSIPFAREVSLVIRYKGNALSCPYRADFICFDQVVVELKALEAITTIHQAQAINYLKATGYERALILNFGAPALNYKRMYLSHSENSLLSFSSADDINAEIDPTIKSLYWGWYER